MDASCKIQRSIHDVRLTYKYVSRILGTYHKRADTPINISVSPRSNRILLNKTSPRRLRAKYTHRTNFVYALCISPCRELYRQQADKFVNRCLCTYSQQSWREAGKEDAYRQTFIYQTK